MQRLELVQLHDQGVVVRVGDDRCVVAEVRLVVPGDLLSEHGDPSRVVAHAWAGTRRATVAAPTTSSGSPES